ncbi:MAG TPA: glycoside hydrolase family 15 protein [Gaiellaceae bacterium]|nr:glycoside hydrolase family 15 protein [Gaiellaceae bacterium]
MRTPERQSGYAPIADYAAIGDGRCLALVAPDGAIDWLCLPELDAPPVLWRLLHANGGGFFVLQPREDFGVERRYTDDSNLLETVFSTSSGTVKVTDGLLTDGGALLPWTELVRKIETIEGEVELEWRLEARPRWGQVEAKASIREDVAFVEWEDDAIAILTYGCGKPRTHGADVSGRFTAGRGEAWLLALLYFHDIPYGLPPRAELEGRLSRTRTYWQTYAREIPYDGPWRGAVRRSVLAQRMLTHSRTGAIAAAPTTSLPERIGGDRNWDYRFSWVRDTSLALESLLAVRLSVECERSLAWVLEASGRGDLMQPMYTLHGEPDLPREDVDVEGYLGSKPVRVGNDAQDQLQLGCYGDVVDAAFRFCEAGHFLDPASAKRVAELADDVCELWQREDAGIWELDPRPYTQSKMACWAALDHALDLADKDRIPADGAKRWRQEREAIREWVESNCWSDDRQAYVMCAGSRELDASVLLAARWGYADPNGERFSATVETLRRELAVGPFMYRTTELRGQEGCFLACSFWLVDAYARAGRTGEARELMEELLDAGSDVGLFAEQIDPDSRAFLGNTPQALTHLSLILAAVSVMRAERNAI